MKILFISGREAAYTRNSVILKGLKQNGVEIIECTDISSSYFVRYPKVLSKFILNTKDFDLIFVGFLGQPLVPIIRKLSKKPIIFDTFLSIYDTMCFDRNKIKPESVIGKMLYWLDKDSCELADKLLLDTNAHIDYFANTFNLNKNKFQRIFVGADDSIFYPVDFDKENPKFIVFYYGTYLPLQGIEYIIKAAKKLEAHEDIEFKIVGKGIEYNKIMNLVEDLSIKNIKFIDWLPYNELPLEITKADICLGGHFSNIDKAKRVISGKTYQFIAMEKPVIIGDNPANRELFENRNNAMLVEMANADALADAIMELKNNEGLRMRIANGGYSTFLQNCTTHIIGNSIKKSIEAYL
ncbi:Glycosyl transferases group 1 [uncultured archaeon]|nr:Glycosyl transferases group 1 [uncultured archaeon]